MSNILEKLYQPTQQYKKDQINFINFIKAYINKFEHENIIIGEDLNSYIDPELDKPKNMTSKDNNPAFRLKMNALLERLNLADCWRIQNLITLEDTPGILRESHRILTIFFYISEHLFLIYRKRPPKTAKVKYTSSRLFSCVERSTYDYCAYFCTNSGQFVYLL